MGTQAVSGYKKETRALVCSRGAVLKFRQELVKEDIGLKKDFINLHLFCGSTPSYPPSSLTVERFLKGHIINQNQLD